MKNTVEKMIHEVNVLSSKLRECYRGVTDLLHQLEVSSGRQYLMQLDCKVLEEEIKKIRSKRFRGYPISNEELMRKLGLTAAILFIKIRDDSRLDLTEDYLQAWAEDRIHQEHPECLDVDGDGPYWEGFSEAPYDMVNRVLKEGIPPKLPESGWVDSLLAQTRAAS